MTTAVAATHRAVEAVWSEPADAQPTELPA